MTDPYPEARRRRRLDRGGTRPPERPRDRGPSARDVEGALQQVSDASVPGTPPVGALQVLRHIDSHEHTTATREVLDFSITAGRPQHGALRSDDHVGHYEVVLPFEEVGLPGFPACCPECGERRARYEYSADHHIAGSERVVCHTCEHCLHSDGWG